MHTTVHHDVRLDELLDALIQVRHPHLLPLLAVHESGDGLALEYGQPPGCPKACDGVGGALEAVHEAGLWVGDVLDRIGLDEQGRVVLAAVGSDWDLRDPFAGHPSVRFADLRIAWRQNGDRLQFAEMSGPLVSCSRSA